MKHSVNSIDLPLRESNKYEKSKIIGKGIIGKGAFGIVSEVKFNDKLYVMKEDRKNDPGYGVGSHQLKEIAILTRLGNHPDIITPVDAFIYIKTKNYGTTSNLVMVIETTDGDLGDFFYKHGKGKSDMKPFSKKKLKIILYQCFRGLAYLHSLNIWHRDIKPYNILYTKHISGIIDVKIADFGLAKIGAYAQYEHTCCLFTYFYRAPEHLEQLIKYTNSSDIWAMGVSMLDLMSRVVYFRGTTSANMILRLNDLFGFNDNNLPGFSNMRI